MNDVYTLEEYLDSDLALEKNCELEAGKIVEMPPESYQNVYIAFQLMIAIAQIIGAARVSNKAEIIISGSKVNARIPDVTVFTEAGVQELAQLNRSTINLDMLPPLLVIEVVSPGKQNRDRDYRYKRSEYAARGIKYYWIIDPENRNITLLELIDGLYEAETYHEDVSIAKPFAIELNFAQLFD